MRSLFRHVAFWAIVLPGVLAFQFKPALWAYVVILPILGMAFQDYFQKKQAIRRNFPFVGRFRYWLEAIRPEISQYFIESNTDGTPFNREQRSIVYQRAKKDLDTLPFGTQRDVYAEGYEWINHSIVTSHIPKEALRVWVGGPDCKQPYHASILNISAMSFGSLSNNAILALNGAAKDGNFAHNTGEGGLSPYHLEPGGDLIWQIGTGYFGCRTPDGNFNEATFAQKSQLPNVKMIEIKISQGAKPGHGGILPARKLTPEIAKIRDVPLGNDVISPSSHKVFHTPIELLQFIKTLRDASGSKPIGFKLCLGKHREFISICKAIEKTGITPDFITIDGGEGGTGAAPLEFSNYVGAPSIDGLIYIHNVLVGFGIRDRMKIISSGKVSVGFDIIKRIALGSDLVNSARAMMMALGCIQALRCNTNACPTGVATQDPNLVAGLVPQDKRKRVATYHAETMRSTREMLEAMGLSGPYELRPWHIHRRITQTEVKHYGEIFQYLKNGELVNENCPEEYQQTMSHASAESFDRSGVRQKLHLA